MRKSLLLIATLLLSIPGFGQIAQDVSVSTATSNSVSSLTSSSFTTTSANELVLAFVSTDGKSTGMKVNSVSGAGLTWKLAQRANGQLGTAEIWYAVAPTPLTNATVQVTLSQSVAALLHILTLTGVDPATPIGAVASSSSKGAPMAALSTTRAQSWVIGVGNDWDNAIARTVPSNQKLVAQYLATVGDTYWVQRLTNPVSAAGSLVAINDTAPTGDQYNLSIAEILPSSTTSSLQTYSVSGYAGLAGAVLKLSGAASQNATADGSGNYSFSGLANGTYTVTPSSNGYTFNPTSQTVTVNGNAVTGVNFTATAAPPTTYSLSGNAGVSGATVTLTGAASRSVIVDSSGGFSFTGLPSGSYTVTPSFSGYTFTPSSKSVSITSSNVTGVNFTASRTQIYYSLSGNAGLASATVTLGGAASATTQTGSTGYYRFSGLASGAYTVTPSASGYAFTPTTRSVSITSSNVSGVNFTASTAQVTYSVSGNAGLAGALVSLGGAATASTQADTSGNFTFSGLSNGSYSVTPTASGYTFTPSSRLLSVNSASVTGVNFTAAAAPAGTGTVFFDDFTDTSTLGTSWYALNRAGDYSNGELQCYKPYNAAIGSSLLTLTFKAESVSCGDAFHSPSTWNYSSSMVQWNSFNFLYGTVEVRAKIPNTSLWPAIWLLGANCQQTNKQSADDSGACSWFQSGSDEIDIAEFAPNDSTARENAYVNGQYKWSCGSGPNTGGDGQFHTYTFTWSTSKMTWAVDGRVNCTVIDSRYIPTKPMFLMLNIASNNSAKPSGLPQTMQIDYVKVTQ